MDLWFKAFMVLQLESFAGPRSFLWTCLYCSWFHQILQHPNLHLLDGRIDSHRQKGNQVVSTTPPSLQKLVAVSRTSHFYTRSGCAEPCHGGSGLWFRQGLEFRFFRFFESLVVFQVRSQFIKIFVAVSWGRQYMGVVSALRVHEGAKGLESNWLNVKSWGAPNSQEITCMLHGGLTRWTFSITKEAGSIIIITDNIILLQRRSFAIQSRPFLLDQHCVFHVLKVTSARQLYSAEGFAAFTRGWIPESLNHVLCQ